MYSDDVYRNQLGEAILSLEDWARNTRDCAGIEMSITPSYWKLESRPQTLGACPFELLLRADQKFNLAIGEEVYEDKPIGKFEFFGMLVRAITAGRVERVDVRNALTGASEAIETRVTLEDGWAWIGERRLLPRPAQRIETAQELRSKRFLPYRR